jgi:hypothetical protein
MLMYQLKITNATKGEVIKTTDWIESPTQVSGELQGRLRTEWGRVLRQFIEDGVHIGWIYTKNVPYPDALASTPRAESHYDRQVEVRLGWKMADGEIVAYDATYHEPYNPARKRRRIMQDASPGAAMRAPMAALTKPTYPPVDDEISAVLEAMADARSVEQKMLLALARKFRASN